MTSILKADGGVPQPQPLPSHDGSGPTGRAPAPAPAAPSVPQPHRAMGMVGTAAMFGALPLAIVATRFGLDAKVAAGIGGAVMGAGFLAINGYRTGPKPQPSPGRIDFDEVVQPHMGVPMVVGGVGAGVAMFAGGMTALDASDYGNPVPRWAVVTGLGVLAAGATVGIGFAGIGIKHWASNVASDAKNG
jgi:hypothetical protein